MLGRGETYFRLLAFFVLVVLGLGGWYFFNVYLPHRKSFYEDQLWRQCSIQMKQLAAGLRKYAEDHGGKYPDSLTGIIGSAYIPSSALLNDPIAKSVASLSGTAMPDGSVQYGAFVYVGRGVTTASSVETPILYEPHTPHFHDEGIYALFVDGRVNWFPSLEDARHSAGDRTDGAWELQIPNAAPSATR
jgi:hypothetical protein